MKLRGTHLQPLYYVSKQRERRRRRKNHPSPPPPDVLHHRRPAPTPYRLPPPAATKACSNPTEPRRDPNAIATTKILLSSNLRGIITHSSDISASVLHRADRRTL